MDLPGRWKWNRIYGWSGGRTKQESEDKVVSGRGNIWLREGMREESARVKGHLKDGMEIYCYVKSPKYTKVILMRSSNNGVTES